MQLTESIDNKLAIEVLKDTSFYLAPKDAQHLGCLRGLVSVDINIEAVIIILSG